MRILRRPRAVVFARDGIDREPRLPDLCDWLERKVNPKPAVTSTRCEQAPVPRGSECDNQP